MQELGASLPEAVLEPALLPKPLPSLLIRAAPLLPSLLPSGLLGRWHVSRLCCPCQVTPCHQQ